MTTKNHSVRAREARWGVHLTDGKTCVAIQCSTSQLASRRKLARKLGRDLLAAKIDDPRLDVRGELAVLDLLETGTDRAWEQKLRRGLDVVARRQTVGPIASSVPSLRLSLVRTRAG
jgi:hypothetical protein